MRILIVDDDPLISEFVKLGLKEEGYAVDTAAAGEQGRVMAYVNDYDGILLDVVLPDASGVEIARDLRAHGRHSPILMLTGKGETRDVVAGLDAGADDYLTKPFEIVELKARVRALVRRGGDRSEERLELAGLSLDPLRHEARNDGETLRLTPREHAVLELLLQNAGRVVSRAELLEKVWEIPYEAESNVVDVQMARLRRTLSQAGVRPRIVAVRGVGFTLTTEPEN